MTEQALCSGVKLVTSATGAVPVGSVVTLTASNASCEAGESAEYRFEVRKDTAGAPTSELRAYAAEATASFDTTGLGSGRYVLRVLARSQGSSAKYESIATRAVLVGDVCTNAKLVASPARSSLPGAQVNLAASSTCTGDSSQAEYRLRVVSQASGTYTTLQDWSVQDTFSWDTAGWSEGAYWLRLEARAVGSTASSESSAQLAYVLDETCSEVTLEATPNGQPGSPVTLSAGATCGGSASAEYRFQYRQDGSTSWNLLRDWSGESTASWSTTGLDEGRYDLKVETRAAGFTAFVQASRRIDYYLGDFCQAPTLLIGYNPPQLPGTEIPVFASSSCSRDVASEYRFSMRTPGSSENTQLRTWGVGETLFWKTAGLPGGKYTLVVEVRAVGASEVHSVTSRSFGLGGVCSLADATLTPEGTQVAGTPLALSASAKCAFENTPQFRFGYRPAGSSAWTTFRDWSGSASATLATGGLSGGDYQLLVEVRGAGHTFPEGSRRLAFTLTDPPPPVASRTHETISVGGDHTCVASAGAVTCWGANGFGQTDVPSGLGNVVSVSAGARHSCALDDQGELTCWGDETSGTELQPGFASARAMTAGTAHTCWIENTGGAECWGQDGYGQSSAPPNIWNFVDISGGGGHTCGLGRNGAVTCWGADTAGQRTVPAGLGLAKLVSAGGAHTCVVDENNAVVCWGDDTQGQSSVPAELGGALSVSAGALHTCAVSQFNQVLCWGDDSYGQSSVPADLGPMVAVSAGDHHTCAIDGADQVTCWGANWAGQTDVPAICPQYTWDHDMNPATACANWTICLPGSYAIPGSSSTNRTCEPCPDGTFNNSVNGSSCTAWTSCGAGQYVSANGTTTSDRECMECPSGTTSSGSNATSCSAASSPISAGASHTCALRSSGAVNCWGQVYFGQAGSFTTPSATMRAVSAGMATSCAIRASDGRLSCWGLDKPFPAEWSNATLGLINGAPTVAVDSVSVGGQHACAIRTDNKNLECWGQPAFTANKPSGAFDAVAAAAYDTCAIRSSDKALICWGQNAFNVHTEPTGQFDALAAGFYVVQGDTPQQHFCGRRTNGTVSCWGSDVSGQVGQTPSVTFDSVDAGGLHSCGIRSSDKRAVCWGNNTQGQGPSSSSVAYDWVTTGYLHSCGVRSSDKRVICWGNNAVGQTTVSFSTAL